MSGNLDAARVGDQRVALLALRDTLAAAMDSCEPNMLPQIAGQYRATLADIAAGTGAFLPNDPVPNSELANVLGDVPGAPERVRTFIQNMAPRMLESGGVESRHFAIDPETHRLTHTVVTLAEPAARRALEAAGRKPAEVELLLLASPNYECSTPPTSALLQERLGIPVCAEMEVHSNCSGVGKMVQIAFDALRVGR